MNWPISQQAMKFGSVGAVGFLIDGGILTILSGIGGFDLLSSRLISFSVAVTITWLLNRQLTFPNRKDRRAIHEWIRYAIVNSLGALLNLAVFLILVVRFDSLAKTPLVPLAIGAAIALLFNYYFSKHIVFRCSQA